MTQEMTSLSNENSRLRATKSISCLPFKKEFYELIDETSISSDALCQRSDWQRFVFVPFGSERAEEHFLWLIKIGVARREVDGQGLTNRIRLTPMGRDVIKQIPGEIPRAGIRAKIAENFLRHLKKF
jgi:hypothetical protein